MDPNIAAHAGMSDGQVVPLFCVRQIPPPLATVPANTAKVTLLNVKNLSAYTWLVAVRVPLASPSPLRHSPSDRCECVPANRCVAFRPLIHRKRWSGNR